MFNFRSDRIAIRGGFSQIADLIAPHAILRILLLLTYSHNITKFVSCREMHTERYAVNIVEDYTIMENNKLLIADK